MARGSRQQRGNTVGVRHNVTQSGDFGEGTVSGNQYRSPGRHCRRGQDGVEATQPGGAGVDLESPSQRRLIDR